jgi:hypothetical protein
MYNHISWDVMLVFTFISKLCSRTSKELSVGACWRSLTHIFNSHIKTTKIDTKLRYRALELTISTSFGVYSFAGGHF